MKRIVRFALFGAIGFGIGGIIIGMGLSWGSSMVVVGIGFVAMGALGGASLGLALRRKVATLALLGAIGFFPGFLAFFFITPLAWKSPFIGTVLFFATAGMIGGATLGLALRNRKEIIGLALAGALGFGIGFGIGMVVFMMSPLERALIGTFVGIIGGIIGGASIGATLGYLEKKGKYHPKQKSF